MEGGRSLVELMYADFIGRAGDEIFNQMAKWQAMSAGALSLPVVLRASVGSKYGAQHSQDWTGLITHIPGLKVIYPATPYDAKGLMASALASEDPVVVFESQRLYDKVETHHADGVPADYYRLPLGVPDVKREGRDLTILTIGPSLYPRSPRRLTFRRAGHRGRGDRRPHARALRLPAASRQRGEDRALPRRHRSLRTRQLRPDGSRRPLPATASPASRRPRA